MATNISGGITTPTSTTHTGNGSTGPFSISFEYSIRDDVQVFVDGVLKTVTTHYTFFNSFSIAFTSGNAPANGAIILIQRNTIVASPTHTFADASVLTATDLNRNNAQIFHGVQELVDDYVKRDGSQTIKGNLVFEGSSDDDNETTLAITNPTADRTITLPDTTGTVVTTGDTGSVSSTMITDGTIVDADINASAAISGSKLQAASGSNAGSMSASDKSKLDGIEANATADQTAAEIRTLVESATDSNVFTDADHTKLNGIEASATADQTAAEIRTLVESATDSNVFTDADHTKLNGIEASATADQTDAEIRAAVEAASDSNVFTDADHTKLNGIEASADVTDATNVDAAGAVMNSDLDTKGEILVGDGAGDPTALSVGQNNYVLIADSNEASGVKWGPAPSAGGLNNIVEDTSPQLGGALDVQAQEINTSTTNGNIKLTPNGTGKVEVKGNTNAGSIQLNCENNSHGVTIKGPAHSAAASYTLTLPNNIVNGQFLKTDTSGNLSWAAVDLTALSASNLTSGTVPDARFPATLPAVSGANLTNLDAADLASGTIPDARFPGTLPASSAANLTNIPAANITGTLPAISGANLTGINTDLVSDSSPQLGGSLDTNGNTITFGTGVGFSKKTGATNAVVNGITQHVKQNSLIIDGGVQDLFFTGGSSGSKITFGSSDGLTHEVMRITPSVLGASQHGKVDLKYVTANAGGSTSSSTKLSTTSTGITVNGTVAATSYTGDGSNLTGVASTVAGGAIYENSQTISSTHTIPSVSNGMSAGPVSVSNGVTLTISSGSTYTVV